jgi:hypothetical protein
MSGSLTFAQVADKWLRKQRAQARRARSPYTCDWATLEGIELDTEEVFPNRDAAIDWLSARAEKWEYALAARFAASEEQVWMLSDIGDDADTERPSRGDDGSMWVVVGLVAF